MTDHRFGVAWRHRAVATVGVAAIGLGCSAGTGGLIVPVTAIASSNDSQITVTAAVGRCADADTSVAVQEGPSSVVVTVRFEGSDCEPDTDFQDVDVQLDGPLGERSLILTQPLSYAEIVGSDVCIIDEDQRSSRCSVEVASEG